LLAALASQVLTLVTACLVCGAAPVSRVFYPISTSFTGSGFYSTDYGQGEQKPESKPLLTTA
jgi:predicted nucleic acid-binding Zn ribbon protein